MLSPELGDIHASQEVFIEQMMISRTRSIRVSYAKRFSSARFLRRRLAAED
jgi:hypothetical protein